MFSLKRTSRSVITSFGLLFAVLTPLHTGSAQAVRFGPNIAGYLGTYPPGRFYGQVTALSGPVGNPTGITLALGTDSVDIRFGQQYSPRPMSAEAEVEGLAVRDYASLEARRVRSGWVTQRVNFDVQPFGRLKSLTGTVVTVTPDGRHLRLRLSDTGSTRWLVTVKQTRYEIDSHPAIGTLPLSRDDTVQVLVFKGDFNWIAADINIKMTTFGSRGSPRPH